MLESRAAYGYYGEGCGATGENVSKRFTGGYSYNYYNFEVDWSVSRYKGFQFNPRIEIKAKSYANALRQLKAWQRRDGFAIIGDLKGCEMQHTDWH